MGKREEYISGPHHFWAQFWCGLVFGAFFSTAIGVSLFESAASILLTVSLGALLIAYCCARWGDSAWSWLIECFRWLP